MKDTHKAKTNSSSEHPDPDLVNYIVTGSRYQVVNDKGEPIPEYGVGVFRSGVQLEVARCLYIALVAQRINQAGLTGTQIQSKTEAEVARKLARAAFTYTESFLAEMDHHMRRPEPNNTSNNP